MIPKPTCTRHIHMPGAQGSLSLLSMAHCKSVFLSKQSQGSQAMPYKGNYQRELCYSAGAQEEGNGTGCLKETGLKEKEGVTLDGSLANEL